ncbi:MAG: lipid-A-disaccharide synthase [Parvularculaceae bacterium]
MSETAPRILLAAVEPSADAIGASVIAALRDRAPGAELFGCGGEAMAAAGFDSAFPTNDLAVMGFTDVARVYFKALARADALMELAAARQADAAVFIDGWAFSRLCAGRFKKRAPATRRLKLVAPQVWASRPQRVDFVREHFDGVMCLLPFEPDWFAAAGVRARFVGNPNFQAAWRARGDGAAFRARHDLGDAPVLGLFLGSRRQEVRRHVEPFAGAAARIVEEAPGVRTIVSAAPGVIDLVRSAADDWPFEPVFVDPDEKYDACAATTAAIAVSGTITTELAINGAAVVVAYKVDPLTAFWVRRVMTGAHASILNVAVDAPAMPELLQEDCEPAKLAAAVRALLLDPGAREEQRAQIAPALAGLRLDGPSAADLAAETILEWTRGG